MMPMICYMQKERTVGFMGVELIIRIRTEQDVHYPVRLHRIWQKDMDLKKLWSAKEYISGALAAMLDLGAGSGPMDHGFDIGGKFTSQSGL